MKVGRFSLGCAPKGSTNEAACSVVILGRVAVYERVLSNARMESMKRQTRMDTILRPRHGRVSRGRHTERVAERTYGS